MHAALTESNQNSGPEKPRGHCFVPEPLKLLLCYGDLCRFNGACQASDGQTKEHGCLITIVSSLFLQSKPVGLHLVPLLDAQAVRFQQCANLHAIPPYDLLEDGDEHGKRVLAEDRALGNVGDVPGH